MAIRCGHCRESHSSVTEVRSCSQVVRVQELLPEQTDGEISTVSDLTDICSVPASKYALVQGDGTLAFFEVQVPRSGKWKDYRFVVRLQGAPGDWRKIRLSRTASVEVLTRIVSDVFVDGLVPLSGPRAAAVRFAREHKRCAVCSSPLSDPDSVSRGMGPVCVGRF